MKRKEPLEVYGRLGLIIAAFALIAGVLASPILKRIVGPDLVIAGHR